MMRALLWVVLGLALVGFRAASAEVAIFAEPGAAKVLAAALKGEGLEARVLEAADLGKIGEIDPEVLIVGPGVKIPPESRKAIHEYRTRAGNLIVMEPTAFAYPTRLTEPVSVADLSDRKSFSVRTSGQGGREPEVEVLPERTASGSSNAVRVTTKLVGDGDVLLEIPLRKVGSAERTVLGFQAKGEARTGILYVAILDTAGRRWMAFVDLFPEWREYEIALADFVRGSKEADGTEMLVPEEVAGLEVGMVSRILWTEQAAAFSLGEVVLGKGTRKEAVRTAAVAPWGDQYRARGAAFPEWIWDPFWEARELGEKVPVRIGGVGSGAGEISRGKIWEAPRMPHARGRVHAPASTKLQPGDYQRRVLAKTVGEEGEEIAVAEWKRFNDGDFAGGSVTLIGAPGEDFSAGTRWAAILRESVRLALEPSIVRVTPVSASWEGEKTGAVLRVTVENPRKERLAARVLARIGQGVTGEADLEVSAEGEATVDVRLSEVPDGFDWRKFDWEVELLAGDTRVDLLRDSVNAGEILLTAARHLVRVQKWQGDGRYGHHFFSDQYGARFLFGFARRLSRTDGGANWGLRVSDAEIAEFRESAFRFGDMIVRRQAKDGSFPMGYMEHRDFVYVADLGQVSLGMVQMASWLEIGDPRREAYLSAVRKYVEFRESFYMTPERVEKLEAEFGKNPKNIRVGHYGLGHLDLDYFGDAKWGELRREERGPWWVLPVSMAFLGGMAQLEEEDPVYAEIAERDIRFYFEADYKVGRGSHFHAESLFWMAFGVKDAEIRTKIAEKLTAELPEQIFRGTEYPYFDHQGRGAIWPLSAVYAKRYLPKAADWDATILVGLLATGSDSSSNSMASVTAQYPRTTYGPSLAANRYAEFSAIWILELLDPGSSLMKGE